MWVAAKARTDVGKYKDAFWSIRALLPEATDQPDRINIAFALQNVGTDRAENVRIDFIADPTELIFKGRGRAEIAWILVAAGEELIIDAEWRQAAGASNPLRELERVSNFKREIIEREDRRTLVVTYDNILGKTKTQTLKLPVFSREWEVAFADWSNAHGG